MRIIIHFTGGCYVNRITFHTGSGRPATGRFCGGFLHLTQSLSSLFSLDLSLVSQQFLSLEFAQVLDKMAYLTVWQGDDVQRRVKGVVTWFELGENDKNQMLYSMKVHPPLWRAGLRQNFRIFQNEDIKSILGTILQENGVTEWSPLFSEPHPSREFCVQYGED